MFDWISHNKELFLQSHTEIGVSYQHALDLQTQHNHFAMNSMVSWEYTVKSRSGSVSKEGQGTWGHLQIRECWGPMRGEAGKVRLGYGSSPLSGKKIDALSAQMLIWLFPWLKISTVLWSLFTFWRVHTIFFTFLTFLWELMRALCSPLIIYASSPIPC